MQPTTRIALPPTAHPIGFHARSWAEFDRVTSLASTNIVELKPDKIGRHSDKRLYRFDGSSFTPDEQVATEIRGKAVDRGIAVQMHPPYERTCDSSKEEGLCQAVSAHHPLLLSRFAMYGRLYDTFGIGSVLTFHGPAFQFGGVELCTEEYAIEQGRLLYFQYDKMMRERGWSFKVGIENMVAPKTGGSSAVGYKPRQIDYMIGDAARIGITVDSGHRRLNSLMSIALLASYGDIVNLHFHSNAGMPNDTDYSDDQHLFATPDNLDHYERFLKAMRRRRIPVILEVDPLDPTFKEQVHHPIF